MRVTAKLTRLVWAAVALGLASCASQKGGDPNQSLVAGDSDKPPEPSVPEPVVPLPPDDGIRLPDMLGMPSEGDLRSPHPSLLKPEKGTGVVISRPPTDPPSRIKPKETAPE
jgi:hypothetical protein